MRVWSTTNPGVSHLCTERVPLGFLFGPTLGDGWPIPTRETRLCEKKKRGVHIISYGWMGGSTTSTRWVLCLEMARWGGSTHYRPIIFPCLSHPAPPPLLFLFECGRAHGMDGKKGPKRAYLHTLGYTGKLHGRRIFERDFRVFFLFMRTLPRAPPPRR